MRLLLSFALLLATPGVAAGQAFSTCLNSAGFSCTSIAVPLDRGGVLPGSVTLAVERHQAGAAPSEDAVVALAGGPGQAAIPLASVAEQAMAPALSSRDLIVFDQRGTGASGPLQCSALERASSGSVGRAFEQCAQQIGPPRGSYTTAESVADIEAIRQALGYRRLVLFGVSYGTKVALEYAERYPANVEALVLDSVVPTGVVDPFSLASFKAMSGAVSELCSANACAGITRKPVANLAQLAARMHGRSLTGTVYDGSGHRHGASISETQLLDLMFAGDLNPALRALLPAAVQSALHGDSAPLLRLNLLSEGLIPNVPLARSSGGVDEALFVDTTCEEAAFPWQRSAPPATRAGEALAALHAVSKSAFYPFDAATEWTSGVFEGCAHWPNVAPAPPGPAPLPQVPTLLLSGAQDVRTPTSNAQTVRARIPGAQLLVVPYTGHSVLGSDFSGCAERAVGSFFGANPIGATPIQPCQKTSNPFSPTPITPVRLSSVKPVQGLRGRPGATLAVVLDTIVDLERQVIGARLQAEQELPSGSSFGGLRGGYAQLSPTRLSLHSLSFVTGVQLSGTFAINAGRLTRSTVRVQGSQAARGTIQIGGSPRVTGALGGVRVNVDLRKVRLARAGHPHEALTPTLSMRFPHPALARVR
ncbi:MAG: alpha/beta hydrolase [Solirubrobacteraceae bacterium]